MSIKGLRKVRSLVGQMPALTVSCHHNKDAFAKRQGLGKYFEKENEEEGKEGTEMGPPH